MNMIGTGVPGTRFLVRRSLRWGALLTGFGIMLGHAPKVAAEEGSSIDREAFLKAIAEVETGGNPRAVGRLGERGLFQFRKETWRQYTRRSFYEAHNPQVSYQVAAEHFNWLYDGFLRNGMRPTPYLMASAWNAGLSRTLSGKATKATRNYARRVANITADLTPRAPEPLFSIRRYFVATGE